MISVAVMGVGGRMGRSILNLLINDKEINLIGATEREGHEAIGKDIGEFLGLGKVGLEVKEKIAQASADADVIVDFTSPEATLNHAQYSAKNKKAMVIGTTGFSEEQKKAVFEFAKSFPCVFSPNMSVGVNILFEVSKQISSLLREGYDVEIVEAHHRNKVDSPSGTAIRLGQSVAEGLGLDFNKVARYERHGNIGERDSNEIGIQTIRGGDIVGEHTVMFLGDGERIEITHKALSRNNFSKGVLRAVKWLPEKSPGIYSMKDVLGL